MSDNAGRDAWVRRVLGVGIASAAVGASEGPLVTYRKALLEFRKARSSVDAQLSSLFKALVSRLPQEAKLADALSRDVAALCDSLQNSIDDGLNAVGEGRQDRIRQVQDEIEDLIGLVSGNRLIIHIDSNPIQPTTVARTLVKALARVADTVN